MEKTEYWLRPGNGTVIALLHGIGADDPQEYWKAFLNILTTDQSLQDYGLFVWKYPTHTAPALWKNLLSSLKQKTLRETAPQIEILSQLWNTTYTTQFRDSRTVILVCHSMGGLVVKSWIVDTLRREQGASLHSLRHISFYATPHQGARIATLIDWNKQLRGMRLDSCFIQEVRDRWNTHVVWWKERTLSSGHQLSNMYIPHLVLAGSNDEVVPPENARIENMPLTIVSGDHSEVIQPFDRNDTKYKVWRDALRDHFEKGASSSHDAGSGFQMPPQLNTPSSTSSSAPPSASEKDEQYLTCVISSSSKDEAFLQQFCNDLQKAQVPYWIAYEDLAIGDKIRTQIYRAIQEHNKLLLVLSKHTIENAWVEAEVEKAFEEERRNPKQLLLFPIRIDNTILETDEAWAADIRRMRHIGDFTQWRDPEAYQKALKRLLRDLRTDRRKATTDQTRFQQMMFPQSSPEIPSSEPFIFSSDQEEKREDIYRIMQSVFLFNLPLNDVKEFYSRKSEYMTLLDRAYLCGSTSIVGARRIGKTWLMRYFMMTAEKKLGSRFRIGYLDATSPECASIPGFTSSALKVLGEGHSTPISLKAGLITLEQTVKDLTRKHFSPVLCIDEFERFSNSRIFDLSFFEELRAIAQIGLCLIIASNNPLIDVVSRNVQTSPFFNIFEQLTLQPFTFKEAEAFIRTKGDQAGFNQLEREYLQTYGKIDEGKWPPLRLQLVGKLLLEDRLLAKHDPDQFRPNDPLYWETFEQRLEKKYRGVVP